MELNELRSQIDAVDARLIELLEQRMDIAAGIAAWKRENNYPVLDAGREAQKFEAVRARCRPETADLIVSLYRDIFAASRAYQTQLLENTADGT